MSTERQVWLDGLKDGDEVCWTNDGVAATLFSMMFGMASGLGMDNSAKPAVTFCRIEKVRGRLSDGSIVVDDKIFTSEGKLPKKHELDTTELTGGELYAPTQELREKSEKLKFIETFNRIMWDKISYEVMSKIADILNDFISNYNEEADTEK